MDKIVFQPAQPLKTKADGGFGPFARASIRAGPAVRYHPGAASRFAVKVRAMADHKFKIGQMVLFYPRASRRIIAHQGRPYRITLRLPEASGRLRYQIRCTETDNDFSADENELRVIA